MLLVLQTLTILDYTRHDTLTARSTINQVLSLVQDDLPDETTAQGLLAARPPGINPVFVTKAVQQVLVLLRQSIMHMPDAATLYLDILSQIRSLAPTADVADELVEQGTLLICVSNSASANCLANESATAVSGHSMPHMPPNPSGLRHAVDADILPTLVAALALDKGTAIRAARLLSWLCTDEHMPLPTRLHVTALLANTAALNHLSALIDPEPKMSSGNSPSIQVL